MRFLLLMCFFFFTAGAMFGYNQENCHYLLYVMTVEKCNFHFAKHQLGTRDSSGDGW